MEEIDEITQTALNNISHFDKPSQKALKKKILFLKSCAISNLLIKNLKRREDEEKISRLFKDLEKDHIAHLNSRLIEIPNLLEALL